MTSANQHWAMQPETARLVDARRDRIYANGQNYDL